MTYDETVDRLYAALPVFHRTGKAAYKADLDNSLKLDEYFNRPHEKYKCVHIAGTNGKGSVSHMIAAVLQTAGLKTGLFTSPHLTDFRERIRINGKKIPKQTVVDFVEKHCEIILETKPSFFEITSAMAFDHFARNNVDIAVIETGMGGRLDSTNIIAPILSVITNIGKDHTEFLGTTIEEIAGEKAGIIKNGIPVVIGEYEAESARVFAEKASKTNSPSVFADKCLKIKNIKNEQTRTTFEIEYANEVIGKKDFSVTIDLIGDYQRKNILTVLASIDLLRQSTPEISDESIKTGLANVVELTGLRGRWQILRTSPLIVCDVGHNAHGLACTIEQLKKTNRKNLYMIFGVSADKDLDSVLPLLPQDAYWYFTQADIPRAMDASVLAKRCTDFGLTGEIATPVSHAFEKAEKAADKDDVIFIGGSVFTVADLLACLHEP